MTRSGRFYEATDKGKGVVEERKKGDEKAEDVVLRKLKKIPAKSIFGNFYAHLRNTGGPW